MVTVAGGVISWPTEARSTPKTARAFLQNQLPLSLVVTTPVELAQPGAELLLSGRQALTAVLSRPVIALGSDFGQLAAQQKFPFRLSCPVPGKSRWVTTTIARFDPDVDWPTDLDCTLSWAADLTSYDGAPLQLGDVPASKRLTSYPLRMSVNSVTSDTAEELTDNMWSPTFGDQSAYELPPDGKIMVSFTYPVNLLMLKDALQIVEATRNNAATVPFDVSPCQSPTTWILGQAIPPEAEPSGLPLDINTTCAVISPRAELNRGANYMIRLPSGARYSALSGPLREEATAMLTGLRPFTMPFQTNFAMTAWSGTSYRRLDLWLLHGLSTDTSVAALAQQIRLCELPGCNGDVSFELSLVSRGRARLSVSSLRPGTQYRLSVIGNAAVRDGYGQALMSSSLTFWTSYVSWAFAGPQLTSSIAVLETGVDSLTAWPYIGRGPPPLDPANSWTSPNYVRRVDSWELDLIDDAAKVKLVKVLQQGYYYYQGSGLSQLLGSSTASLDVPAELRTPGSAAGWTEIQLPLVSTGTSKARILSSAGTSGPFYDARVLLNSSLSFTVLQAGQRLTAWVLDAAASGGPLAGAVVSVYYPPSSWTINNMPVEPVLLDRCTTDADGMCTLSTASARDGGSITAFAVAGDRVAVLPNTGYIQAPPSPPAFAASLVADRKVIVPGDSLKVTGFVQQASPSGLQLPPASWAVLEVSPPWTSGSASGSSGGGPVGVGISNPGRGLRQARDFTAKMGLAAVATTAAVAVDLPVATSVSSSSVLAQPGVATLIAPEKVAVNYANVASSDMAAGAAVEMPLTIGNPSAAQPARFWVKLNGSTGTLHGEVAVPSDATPQTYTLTLRLPAPGSSDGDPSRPQPADSAADSWGTAYSAQLGFVVSDPRPPTADLKLVAPAWVPPNGSVPLSVRAVSYIGASVGGASMTLTWRTAKASGTQQLTTDAAGAAAATIDLGALPEANLTAEYDSLSVNVEWVGPTRERIVRTASVTLANGPARLAISLSLFTDLPGIAFAPSAALTSNTDGSPMLGLPVEFRLRPDPNATEGAACTTESSCIAASGAGPSRDCQLSLPCVGRFRLEGCAQVPSGAGSDSVRVCATMPLGRNASQWQDSPLQAYSTPNLVTDRPSYSLGDTATLRFQNPWPDARLLLQWGNSYRVRTKVVRQLGSGLAEVLVGPLGDECVGGCSLTAVLDVARVGTLTPPLPPAEQLPISRLFDPRAPHSHTMTVALPVRPNNALNVSVAVSAPEGAADAGVVVRDVDGAELTTIEPGAQAQISVRVTSGPLSSDPAPPAGSVEVTVYAVDRAFLDLLPYDLPHPEQQVLLQLAADIARYGMEPYRLAPGAVRAVYDKLMARLTNQDPWLPVDTTVSTGGLPSYYGSGSSSYWRGYGPAAVDANDTKYLASYSTALTYMPNYYYAYNTGGWGGGIVDDAFVSMPATGTAVSAGVSGSASNTARPGAIPPTGAAEAGGSGSADANKSLVSASTSSSAAGSSGPAVRQEADFVVTPLFATALTDDSGRAVVTFTAPQNLGTFVIRAFAAAGASAKYGSAEGKLAVRRRLSLTPSVPRFVRVGDVFEAGVVVTVGSAPASVTVTLQVADLELNPLTLTGESSKTVSFSAEGGLQQEVRFSFTAAAIGNASLTFSASDSQPGGGQDAVSLDIPVEGQQGDVWVATTFALNASAGPEAQWQEGMVLPSAVPGSGGLTLTAGVGYFPAINSTYDNLLLTQADRVYPEAAPAVLWATLPAVLSYYGQRTSDAQSAAVRSAFTDLAKLTSPNVGLMWTDPSQWGSWIWQRTDIYLNTWALFLTAQHERAMSSLSADLSTFYGGWATLRNASLPAWRSAVERQLVADATEARGSSGGRTAFSDWHTLAWARLVLGATWEPSGVDNTVRRDLSLDALLAASGNVGRETRVVISLALQSLGGSNPNPRLLASTLDEVTSALRTQGRTAYVATAPGSASASSLSDQALSLLLLLRSGATHQLIPKLAAYVANPARTGAGPPSIFTCLPSWTERGLAVAALAEYDSSRGSSQPELELAADANGLTVLAASFRTGGNIDPVSNTTAWELLPAAPSGQTSTLGFEVSGRGEVSVSASLRFVPTSLLSYPVYRGLYLESALQLIDPLSGSPTGRRLRAVPLGATVALTLQLTSPDDLGAVTLEVMMPGGLEPIDPNVAAGVDSGCGASWGGSDNYYDASSYRWWWWPVCPAQETRPSRVTFSYAALRAGTSSVTLRAVAATAGTFVFPPARAFAVQQPELMGMTPAGSLTVCADCAGPTYGTAPPPPNACPANCSGNGVCNLATGRCRCDPGFTRSDCSRPVA